MSEYVYVYRNDSLNDLMCISKEHYELYKSNFTLNVELKKEVEVKEEVVEVKKRTAKAKV